jgi:rhodanese-related sulfurtransferase
MAVSRILRCAALAIVLPHLTAAAVAAGASIIPEAKRTTLGLYLTSDEVAPFLAKTHGRSLFVDVRTKEETAEGGPARVDANIPFAFAGGGGTLEPNPGFVAQVEAGLAAKGLARTDPVVLICRSGRRSARAADLLARAGLTRVYSVIDGLEGGGPAEPR